MRDERHGTPPCRTPDSEGPPRRGLLGMGAWPSGRGQDELGKPGRGSTSRRGGSNSWGRSEGGNPRLGRAMPRTGFRCVAADQAIAEKCSMAAISSKGPPLLRGTARRRSRTPFTKALPDFGPPFKQPPGAAHAGSRRRGGLRHPAAALVSALTGALESQAQGGSSRTR